MDQTESFHGLGTQRLQVSTVKYSNIILAICSHFKMLDKEWLTIFPLFGETMDLSDASAVRNTLMG